MCGKLNEHCLRQLAGFVEPRICGSTKPASCRREIGKQTNKKKTEIKDLQYQEQELRTVNNKTWDHKPDFQASTTCKASSSFVIYYRKHIQK